LALGEILGNMFELALFLIFWGTWSLTCLAGVTFLVLVPKTKGSITAMIALGASLAASIYTLSLSMTVFAVGGSSHIRQLAGVSGLPLWELWKNSWPILVLVNPTSILLALVALYLPPSSRKHRDWLWLRFFVLLGAVISVCLTVGKLPNAYAAADFWQ
jgi:hypothetical protein